jgi:hypothetical protein
VRFRLPKAPAWLLTGYEWVNEPCGWTVRVPRRLSGSYQVLRIDLIEATVAVLTVLGTYLYTASVGRALATFIAWVLVWWTINFVIMR